MICLKVIVFFFYNKNIICENSVYIYFFFVKYIYNLLLKIYDVCCDNNIWLWIYVYIVIL